MTMVTIVRQSSSNVEAGGSVVVVVGGFFFKWRGVLKLFIFLAKSQEVQRQWGKRAENKHACVSMRE